MRTAATLNSGMRDIGSRARLVSWLAACAPGQWYGMNTVSGRMVATTCAGRVMSPRREVDGDEVAVGDAELLGEARVHLAQRLGVLAHERADAPGLRAREVLADDPAGGEPDRVLVVDDLGRLAERDRVEAGPAVGVEEPAALEQARRARVADFGDGPEHAHLASIRSQVTPR